MLPDASNNLTATMQWNSAARKMPGAQVSGRDRILSEGYSQDDIKNGFRVDVVSPKVALGDRLKMACAALFSIVIPLGFICALFATTAYWLGLTWQTFSARGESFTLIMGVYLAGDVFLLGFIFALIRRLVLIRRGAKNYYELAPEAQPELHAFINYIADLLQGPKPQSVKLDAEVGLVLRPAGLREALSGVGPEVVIGLPLLYGLSARQLAGVIAHAYAGYTLEARLHGYPILCAIDRWLLTQSGQGRSNVLGRDDITGKRKTCIGQLILPFDVLVQGSFYLVYRFISALTFDVSRKVDMAGDLFSARIAGSTEFRSTQFRLRSLHYGQMNANQELFNSWRSKKLPDNFSALVVDHADTLQLTLRPRLIQEMEELVTPLTRSRIVDLGRIVNVEHSQEEGACFLLGAAISLLRDPAKVSKMVTVGHYRYVGIRHPDLYSSQKIQSTQKAEREKAKRHDVFCGLERSSRIIRLEDFENYRVLPMEARLQDYCLLSDDLRKQGAQIGHLADTVREYEFRKNLLHTRKVMEECKGAGQQVSKELEVQWLTSIKEQSEFKSRLVPAESLFSRKAGIGLSLALDSPEVQEQLQMTYQEIHSHFLHLFDALNFLHRSYESIQRLRSYTQVLGQLLVESGSEFRCSLQITEMSNRYQKYLLIELDSLMRVLCGLTYPLGGIDFSTSASARGGRVKEAGLLTVSDVVCMEIADIDSASTCPEACHRVANALCQYLDGFNEQLQQRISRILNATEHHYLKESEEEVEPR